MPLWEGVYRSSSEEKRLIKAHPGNAQTSIHLAYLAGSVTALLFLPRNYHNNNGDAFRHCFWSSLIAKEISTDWARLWTMAHEMNASPSNKYRQMDEFNNIQGTQILKSNPSLSTVSLIRRCLDLVENGSLREVKSGKLVPTTIDGFNLPHIFNAISEKATEVVGFMAQYYSESTQEIDGDGNTALHRCIMNDYQDGFNILIRVLDVNGSGADGLSPLMRCSLQGHGHKYARALLERGANANYQNPFTGETTLMLAAKFNNGEIVDILLPVANRDLRSFSGLRAYDMAMNEENIDIAKRLL